MMTAESRGGGGAWVALLSGGAPWSADEQRISSAHRLISFIEILALLGALGMVWGMVLLDDSMPTAPGSVASVAVAALLIDPVLRLVRRPPLSRDVGFYLFVHGFMILLVGLCLLRVLHGWAALFSGVIGVAVGADASLTLADIGWRSEPVRWWVRLFTSPFHIGVVVGLLLAVLIRNDASWGEIWPIYTTLHVWGIVTLFTAWCIGDILSRVDADRTELETGVRRAESRRRAHWLHDDILAQLRLVSLRVQTGDADRADIVQMLDGLDHQLRLSQLDELYASGSVRVAEVLQPYIRKALNCGLRVPSVPAFDEASTSLDEPAARLLGRAASVLSSNAMNAGATELAFVVEVRDGMVNLTVRDNGPGLTAGMIHPGRGLWTLDHDLKPGGITVLPTESGGAVRAEIPLREGGADGDDPAG